MGVSARGLAIKKFVGGSMAGSWLLPWMSYHWDTDVKFSTGEYRKTGLCVRSNRKILSRRKQLPKVWINLKHKVFCFASQSNSKQRISQKKTKNPRAILQPVLTLQHPKGTHAQYTPQIPTLTYSPRHPTNFDSLTTPLS